MIYIARIEGGTVAQVIVAAEGSEAAVGWAVVGPENVVGIGWLYQDGQFIAPETGEVEE